MFLNRDFLSVNGQGRLTVGGADTIELAATYGTPLYVMSEDAIRASCRGYMSALNRYNGGYGRVFYASKAFCCKEMCRIATAEGLGLDVASGGELHTALSAGADPACICFHGNNKTVEELTFAVRSGVGWVAVDNLPELYRLDELACAAGKTVRVLLRVKPGVEAHTHAYIRTGQIDSKFGFALETGEAMEAVVAAEKAPGLELDGLHCHIGSQIFETAPYVRAATVMMDFLRDASVRLGRELPVLNLGGGFGVRYTPEDDPLPCDACMEPIFRAVQESCVRLKMKPPFLCFEPGRSIVAPAGATLYTVGSVKKIPGARTYAAVDGGMTDNPRYALYKSEYTILAAARAAEPKDAVVTLAGRCCESGDMLGENLPVQALSEGDVVAVLTTGAYNYSMASNYNRLPRPAVVFVRDGQPRIVVRRESYEDVARLDA